MTSTRLSGQNTAELLAALQLQREWGADEAIEDIPWSPQTEHQIEPPPASEFRHSFPITGEGSSGVLGGEQPLRFSTTTVPPVPVVERSYAQLLEARDVQELVAVACQIEGLTLPRTAMHALLPVYVERAPFMIIGEVPNADEDRSGTLFAGQSGELLEKILASIGQKTTQLSLAASIPWRPPGGRPLSALERRVALPLLQRSIALCRPRCLLTMGTTPAGLLLGTEKRLAQLRGRWTEVVIPGLDVPVPLLPTLHPLQLTGGPVLRKNLWKDMLSLRRRL